PENTGVFPAEGYGQEIRQRYLDEPEKDEVDARGRDGIAGAVERLHGYHPPAIDEERVGQYPDPLSSDIYDGYIVGEDVDQVCVKKEVHHRHAHQECHIVEARPPHGRFRAFRGAGAQILPHKRGRGVRQSPGWHHGHHHNPYGNGGTCNGGTPDIGEDPHQKYPRRHVDEHLADTAEGCFENMKHYTCSPLHLLPCHLNMLASMEQYP